MLFSPATHGLPFPNWFPPGTPVVELATSFGRIRIGDAHGGVCGGMVFAALDHFFDGKPPPQKPSPPVFRYLCRRLLASWNFPFGVLKYYDGQRRPGSSRFLHGVRVVDGLSRLTITVEWPRIQAALDAGLPVPLGLVKARGYDPRLMGRHHQVLAYQYQISPDDDLTLDVYDPNYPTELIALRVNLQTPDRDRPVFHSREGPSVRGFFAVEYRRPG